MNRKQPGSDEEDHEGFKQESLKKAEEKASNDHRI